MQNGTVFQDLPDALDLLDPLDPKGTTGFSRHGWPSGPAGDWSYLYPVQWDRLALRCGYRQYLDPLAQGEIRETSAILDHQGEQGDSARATKVAGVIRDRRRYRICMGSARYDRKVSTGE